MILFADRHYDTYAGRLMGNHLRAVTDITYVEEDYPRLLEALAAAPRSILALHAIAGTPGNEDIPDGVEESVKAHLERGNDVWLLHGGGAAFWPWPWWREWMRVRWIRRNDPDIADPSWHPVTPYSLIPTASGLSACPGLRALDLPADELYLNLHQHGDVDIWMTADYDGRSWPQVYVHDTPAGGRAFGFIPGHDPAVIQSAPFAASFKQIAANWLSVHR